MSSGQILARSPASPVGMAPCARHQESSALPSHSRLELPFGQKIVRLKTHRRRLSHLEMHSCRRSCVVAVNVRDQAPGAHLNVSNRKEPTLRMRHSKKRESVDDAWKALLRWGQSRQEKSEQLNELDSTHKVVIFGGGSFGTAMATLMARNKDTLEVVMLMRDAEVAKTINEEHYNPKYMSSREIPANVSATTDAAAALAGAQYAFHSVPVQSTRAFLTLHKDLIPSTLPIITLSKGLELGTGLMMDEIIHSVLDRRQPVIALSGPTFAIEMLDSRPTVMVAACADEKLARKVSSILASQSLRVNTSTDVVGVEISGALKNVLAIAAGITEGLGLGHNSMAALVAQGMSEIRWLAERMGAKTATLAGPSGVGDVMLTCFVSLSRNRTVGVRLGQGEKLSAILASMGEVAEGVATAGVVVSLARKYRVSLPVLTAVARILEGESEDASAAHLSPREAVMELMALPQISER
mmetsp:Transcript_9883/g.36189  ORF Transcript_9883/g.36189 Transcript_9883/m.36189 type:complete len:469 (-) Transcript_9883:2167-3573(-)